MPNIQFERQKSCTWTCLLELNRKIQKARIIVHSFVPELTDSYLSKYKSYRIKHMLESFLWWSATKIVKYIREDLLFQYERLKYYRLDIKGRIKLCRKNKSTERFSDLFTQGHIIGQHQRKQHEGNLYPAMCRQLYIISLYYKSVLHQKIPIQKLWS